MPHSAVRVSQYLMNLFEEELNAEGETGKIVLGNTSASGAEDSLTDFDAPTQAYSQSGTQAKAEFADSSAVPANTDFHEAVTSMEAPRSRIDASDATQRDVFSSSERLVQDSDGTQVTQSQGAAGPFLPAAAPVQGAGAKRAGIAAAALFVGGRVSLWCFANVQTWSNACAKSRTTNHDTAQIGPATPTVFSKG